MDSSLLFYATNLGVWIDALAQRPASSINLGAYRDGAGDAQTHCAAGLLALLPHFQALGVVPDQRGAPVMAGPDGTMLSVGDTLLHLFGRYGRWTASSVLSSPTGSGRWDHKLYAVLGYQCGGKDLALARLRRARELLTSHAMEIPGVGWHAVEPNRRFYCQNLLLLIDEIQRRQEGEIGLDTFAEDVAGRMRYCPARLIGELPYFRALGIELSARFDGAPVMRGPGGVEWVADRTFDHLFGRFDGERAFDALFMRYGDGCWDRQIIGIWGGTPSHKQLALARLYRALEHLIGVRSPRAPITPRAIVKQTVTRELVALGWTEVDHPSCAARKFVTTAVGEREALTYLTAGDGDFYTLYGDYQSEGRNLLACGVLVPCSASVDAVVRITHGFAKQADAEIAASYAVRLLAR